MFSQAHYFSWTERPKPKEQARATVHEGEAVFFRAKYRKITPVDAATWTKEVAHLKPVEKANVVTSGTAGDKLWADRAPIPAPIPKAQTARPKPPTPRPSTLKEVMDGAMGQSVEVFISALGPPASLIDIDPTTRAFSWQFTATRELQQSASDAISGVISDTFAGVAAGMKAMLSDAGRLPQRRQPMPRKSRPNSAKLRGR